MTHSWLSRIIYGAYARTQVCAGSEGMKISMGEDVCKFMWEDKSVWLAADDSAANVVRCDTMLAGLRGQLAARPSATDMTLMSTKERAEERLRRRDLQHAIWVGTVAERMTHDRINYNAEFVKIVQLEKLLIWSRTAGA